MDKETVEIISQIAVVPAVVFSGVALYLSSRNIKLQRKSMQANMFNDITKRINELLDDIPPEGKDQKFINWNINLLNAFEFFSFFANHGYLRREMTSHYHNFITGYCDSLREKCPSAIKHLDKTKHAKQYSELKRYYKNITGKNAPI